MTESEAIKVFNTILVFGKCSLPNDEAKETIKVAINALEKQIPKKPFIYTTDKDRSAYCPVCNNIVDWTYEGFWIKGNPKYCRDCGQRIDFESEM